MFMIKALKDLTSSEKFVVLALAAEEILKDQAVVFYYFGPARLKKISKGLKKEKLCDIIAELKELENETFSLSNCPPVFRRSYLASQVHSLRSFLEYAGLKPEGEALLQAVRNVIGIEAPKPYNVGELSHKMNLVLSRHGYTSYKEYEEDLKKSDSPVTNLELEKIALRLKGFAKADIAPRLRYGEKLIKKLDMSSVSFHAAEKGYPECYYIYEGSYNARICLSKYHKRNPLTALQALMHELYPGHHLYYLYREMLFEEGFLGEEATIDLLYSAETTLNEGIAETAFRFIDSFDPEEKAYIEISSMREQFCKKIAYNVWYKKNVEKTMTRTAGEEYLKEFAHINEDRFDELFYLMDDWRIYYPAYPAGLDVVSGFIANAGEKALFELYIPKSIERLRKEGL